MTKKIEILTLEGCDSCLNFKTKLNKERIPYEEILCSGMNSFCDNVENLTNCNTYPIAIINKKIFVCLTTNYELLGKNFSLMSDCVVIYRHSIDDLLYLIKNY